MSTGRFFMCRARFSPMKPARSVVSSAFVPRISDWRTKLGSDSTLT